jgi:hypothetical protein
MALQTSGLIAISQLQNEFGTGVGSPTRLSNFYRGGGIVTDGSTTANIPTSGTIRLSNFYGASSADLTPDAVNWSDAGSTYAVYGGRGITSYNYITGISQSITLQLVLVDFFHTDRENDPGSTAGVDIDYAFGNIGRDDAGWQLLGTCRNIGEAFGNIIVNNGAGIKFRFTTGGTGEGPGGNMSATIGVRNISVSPATTLDTFRCTASWQGNTGGGGGGPIIRD